ncbi:carboxypeptidase-like regulatory domain-containing protein [Nitrosomonas mobilis]|uniref:carboxypeptidase-like regulatory domain-containing protein n=1 Tax=Nitrosomonas mobilis TaxID=51642 RepID=UPI0015A43BF5|nr:carboxypeptidase-like regulatory domain-containing protein [Nitrosomonas mobilis]
MTPLQYLLVAGLLLIVALLLLGLMLFHAEILVRLGLIGNLWYFMLLAMGLAVAVFSNLGLKSYSRYTGKVFGGMLELGGPAVLMLVIVGLGFKFVEPPLARFDLTVFVHGEAGPQAIVLRNQGALLLDLGADRRRETIGDKGEVRFVGIPNDQRGRTVPVSLEAEGYELVDPKAGVRLSAETAYLAVRPASLQLSGRVQDEKGRAVPGAKLRLSTYTARSMEDGWFSFKVPSNLPISERTLYVTAPGFEPSHLQITPGANQLTVVLEKEYIERVHQYTIR